MFLAEMSTVASQVACKHGVDVLRDFIYLLMDARVKILRDLLCIRLVTVYRVSVYRWKIVDGFVLFCFVFF